MSKSFDGKIGEQIKKLGDNPEIDDLVEEIEYFKSIPNTYRVLNATCLRIHKVDLFTWITETYASFEDEDKYTMLCKFLLDIWVPEASYHHLDIFLRLLIQDEDDTRCYNYCNESEEYINIIKYFKL